MRTLRNAIEQGKVHHAYLFVGSRGTGKTSMAKMLAACLNCVQRARRSSRAGLRVVRVDRQRARRWTSSRWTRRPTTRSTTSASCATRVPVRAGLRPLQGLHPRRGAHALLGGVERVPQDARGAAAVTIFVLATTEAHKVLPTVVDRCHRFDFRRPTVEQLATVVQRVADQESIEIAPPRRSRCVARHATGSFRDALGTLEQLVTYCGRDDRDRGRAGGARRRRRRPAVRRAGRDRRARRARGAGRRGARWPTRPRRRAVPEGPRDPRARRARGPDARRGPGGARDDRRARRAAGRPGPRACRRATSSGCSTCSPRRRCGCPRTARTRSTQLELALVKAAAPEVDPSTRALLARLERLEARRRRRRLPQSGSAAAPRLRHAST